MTGKKSRNEKEVRLRVGRAGSRAEEQEPGGIQTGGSSQA